jgi:hypothetical protein
MADDSEDELPDVPLKPKVNAFALMMQPKRQKVVAPKVAVPEVDPIVIAVIYIRWLRWIASTEPLFGAPYVGQSVSGMFDTPERVANERWNAENRQAIREDHAIGLLACIDMYGNDAFDDNVVEWRRGPRSVVQVWANEREIALIAEHGGPLRDPTKRLKQTLNLTKGGKGNVNFAARDALSLLKWTKFCCEMQEYVDLHKDSVVSRFYTSSSGYRLGQQLANVRVGMYWKGQTTELARKTWLETLPGFTWSVNQSSWELFLHELQLFVQSTGTANVTQNHVAASGYKLGWHVSNVRCGAYWKGHAKEQRRKQLLEELPGWVWSSYDVSWQTFLNALKAYVALHNTSKVPLGFVTKSGYKLGSQLANVRSGMYWRGHPDKKHRKELLEALPHWTWSPFELAWQNFKSALQKYVETKGTSIVPNKYVDLAGYKLGSQLNCVRYQGRFWKNKPDEAERVAWLEALPGWTWPKKKAKAPVPPKSKAPAAAASSSSGAAVGFDTDSDSD